MLTILIGLTSCLNETDDSNSGELQLPNNVATLSEQTVAMRSSREALESLQTTLPETTDFERFTVQLESCVIAVDEHIAAVEAGLSATDAVMAAMGLQSKIAGVLGSLKVYVGFISEDTALQSSIRSVESGIAAWLGKNFNNYFEVCSEHSRLQSMLAVVEAQTFSVDAIASDVEAGLRLGDASDLEDVIASVDASSEILAQLNQKMASLSGEVEQGYAEAFKKSNTKSDLKSLNAKAAAVLSETRTTLDELLSRIANCEAEIAALNERLTKIEADVAELLGLIQSVTFVSEYSTENAIAYYEMDKNNKVADTELPYYGKAQRTATGLMELNYFIRPAAASTALNANPDAVKVIGYYAKTIATKAVSAADYIDFKVEKVVATDANRGLVTVTVKPDLKEAFYYKEIGAKCALSIKSGKTDIASDFVEIFPMDHSAEVFVTGIALSHQSIEIDKGETTSLSATVTPSDANYKTYSWSSSNDNVVTVSASGVLTAVGVGEAIVTATTHGVDEWGLPLTAECKVKVNEAFRLSGPPYVEVGYTADLVLDYPATAIVESKVWKSSDTSKATVDQNGKVTGVNHTYNTTTKEYNDVTVSCTINGATVVSWSMLVAATQPKSIVTPSLSDGQTEVSMRVDESFSLASTISPANVPDGAYKIRYQSDRDRFINFDTGIINEAKNTLDPASAYVYITVDNRDQDKYMVVGALKKTIIVRVLPYYVKTISFDPVEMQLGQTVTLSPRFTADVDGKTPTNTAVTWHSSNETVATVDANGVVTSRSSGNVTITATATDGSNVSGTCSVTITQPWKSFDLGDYVVRTSGGDIEFASDVNAARTKGTIVGVVVAKTNPRATDPMLPSTCTHGVAVALGESGEVAWWSGTPSSSPYKVYEWAIQNGYQSTMGVDWSSSKGTHLTGTYDLFVGYNNTTALQAFTAAKGVTSEMLTAVLDYRMSNSAPTLPNDASQYYLPSYAEMNAIAALSNNTLYLSNKVKDAGGTAFTNAYYWVVSDSGNSSSNALKVNPLTGSWSGSEMKTNKFRVRYVFAF